MTGFALRATVAAAVFFGFVVALYALYTVRLVLVILFIALVLAAAIRPLAGALKRRLSLPWTGAVAVVYLGFVLVVVVAVLTITPAIVAEVSALVSALPEYLEQAAAGFDEIERLASIYARVPNLSDQLAQVTTMVPEALGQAVRLPLGVLSVGVVLLSTFFLAFYWLLERDAILRSLTRLVPRSERGEFGQIIVKIEDRLGAYVRGQLLVMGIVGLLTLVGLLLLGVRFALVLALVAALLEIIPIIGPIIAAVPAIFLAFFQSPALALAVTVLYIIVQQTESYLVTPLVQERAIRLSKFLILLAVLIGVEMFGILGALIAVPVLVVLAVLAEELGPPPEPSERPSEETDRSTDIPGKQQ